MYSPHSRHIWPRPEVKKKDMVFLSDANIYSASACVGSALMGYTRFRSSTAYRRHCASREFRFSESRSDRFSISFSWQPWESFYAVSVWRAACARLTQKEAGMHSGMANTILCGMPVFSALGKHAPRYPRCFIRHSHTGLVSSSPGDEFYNPGVWSIFWRLSGENASNR